MSSATNGSDGGGGGGWENVKGFFRRKTQLIGEKYRHAAMTSDPLLDQNAATVTEYQKRIRSLDSHMKGFIAALGQTLACMDAIQDDFTALQQFNESLETTATSIDMAVKSMRTQLETTQTAFGTGTEARLQYDKDCEQFHAVLEDRKAKMLEFDFFKNKLAGLRAKPPSDPARLPRNEQRVENWSNQYEEANAKAKQLSQNLIGLGAKLTTTCASTVLGESGRFFDGAGRICRASFLGQSLAQTGAAAMATAQASMATAQATAVAATAQAQAAVQNAPQSMEQIAPQAAVAARQVAQQAAETARQQAASQPPREPSSDSFDHTHSNPSPTRSSLPPSGPSSQRTFPSDDPFNVS